MAVADKMSVVDQYRALGISERIEKCMVGLHIQYLKTDIDQYLSFVSKKMVDKTHFVREIGRYSGFRGQ